ncbi:ADP-dependent NAD(P)H-hydrate dehydratase [Microbacterium dauci]|uniref:ADP-dependent (S)-NAD(P)H-hydrate dehydratase n=1 Tax=Microbacterium dauci TaxID=3048008 RepID=A0ABT6Z9Z1_9MICO|nr:ADP/ATP-dependent (S)-NAD(P)H-hydrate dehydratase [Microbacterium sp. LX3-4]MDJ1112987.1 NAD(P)H-hydrate dehydratase [Microbacterium sp. LX3-4]
MTGRGWTEADVAAVLRSPTASDDKYSRGVVGMRTGSTAFPGAAVLGVEAAWRTGVGMVRYLGPAASLVLARRPETVAAAGRVQAWVIGSGTNAASRDAAETEALREVLEGSVPVVVDAGALDLAPAASAPVIVTPHAGEHGQLRDALGLDADVDSPAETATALGAVVVRKGARSEIAAPGLDSLVVEAPTSWLATAGTGDVLAGIVGALAAGADATDAPTLQRIAASAVWLHGQAASAAVAANGGGPIVALDVAEHIPGVIGRVLRR